MRWLLRTVLGGLIRHGRLEVVPWNGPPFTVGDGSGPPLRLILTDRRAALRLIAHPDLAFGELYMDGRLRVEGGDIAAMLALFLENTANGVVVPWPAHVVRFWRLLIRRIAQHNAGARAQRNVAHHYDLDGRLYSLFLDADRQYSCAYFETPDQGLDEAQLAKKRHIAAKLLVEPGTRILDIGSGWGGLALYLAERAGADVTGITLSEEQLAVARGRGSERGLERPPQFRLQDYRAVDETFDRIVSVGMFEHVGVGFYRKFFRHVAKLLTDDGVMLLHSIGRTEGPAATSPWTAKYIFPGGYIPALSEVVTAIEKSGLVITDIEILRLHYAETVKAWRQRFHARREEVLALYDERFFRMWDFYLAGSEMSFRFNGMMVMQIQIAKRHGTVPLTRDYIAERERRLRLAEGRRANLRLAGE